MRLVASVIFLATIVFAAEPSGALGGRFSGAGIARPLGGIPAPTQQHRGGTRRGFGTPYVYPYAYSWYSPGYLDSPATSAPAPYVDAAPPVAPAPPVIINQYFAPPPQPIVESPPPTAGEPSGPVDNYYLIAYKDRSIYPVISYWVEDKTLHYVTTRNTHNQASLDLIDLDKTKALNKSRDVPFGLPGQ
jgi:hypothetical protein